MKFRTLKIAISIVTVAALPTAFLVACESKHEENSSYDGNSTTRSEYVVKYTDSMSFAAMQGMTKIETIIISSTSTPTAEDVAIKLGIHPIGDFRINIIDIHRV